MSQLVKKLSQALSTPKKSGRRNNVGRRRRMMARRSNASRVPRGILAGYGSAVTASFYQRRRGDGEIVRGFDLVTTPYNPSNLLAPNISYFITANPASWNGTRIAAIAAGYQNYRPLSFKIHYRPQVGSTSTVSMFIGTVWQNNYMTNRSTIEPSLVTSPGGTYLPAWQSCCSVVPLGRRLPQRMFPIRDPDFSTVPFSVVCRASDGGPDSDSVAMPGRIFIEYVYEFRNAIGSGSTGFQPGTTVNRLVSLNQLYEGTTSLGYRVTNTSVGFATCGWIVDVDSGTAGTSGISNLFPIFAKYSTDEMVASTTSGGTSGIQSLVEVNGTPPQVVASTPVPRALQIYFDDGAPS